MERDHKIFDLIKQEKDRQMHGVELIASENFVSDQVQYFFVNVTGNIDIDPDVTFEEAVVADNKRFGGVVGYRQVSAEVGSVGEFAAAEVELD